jgi:hypothetical protein
VVPVRGAVAADIAAAKIHGLVVVVLVVVMGAPCELVAASAFAGMNDWSGVHH